MLHSPAPHSQADQLAVIAIGRNEGARLVACLDSLQGKAERIVYVDSGSTDNSCAEARARDALVVDLDMSTPFTAARARNAGVAALRDMGALPDYIQFIDGDCVIQDGWLETGLSFLQDTPEAAIACGRNRERFPEHSVYNQLADLEWDTPIGRTDACGGIFMIRTQAFEQMKGFDPGLIAGEEPELCVRLRAAGWQIWRLDTEMTLHDAALLHFSQWWQRTKRSGYAYAEAAVMHGASPERHGVRNVMRIVFWAVLLPALILLGAFFTPWSLLLILMWPLQMLRRRLKGDPWVQILFLQLGKFAEARGIMTYFWRQLTAADAKLIEHK